jgi:hypothetical protein
VTRSGGTGGGLGGSRSQPPIKCLNISRKENGGRKNFISHFSFSKRTMYDRPVPYIPEKNKNCQIWKYALKK